MDTSWKVEPSYPQTASLKGSRVSGAGGEAEKTHHGGDREEKRRRKSSVRTHRLKSTLVVLGEWSRDSKGERQKRRRGRSNSAEGNSREPENKSLLLLLLLLAHWLKTKAYPILT